MGGLPLRLSSISAIASLFARPLIPSAIVTCWVSSRTRPMPRRPSMLGTRNTRRPDILGHLHTVTMINVCYDSSDVSEVHSKMISNLWHFESCGFTCDFLLEDWQDHSDFALSQATAVSVLWPVWCQVTGQNYQDDVVTRHHSTVIQVFWTSSISIRYSCFTIITPSTLKHNLDSSIFLQSIGAHLSGNKYPINLIIINAFNPNDPYFGRVDLMKWMVNPPKKEVSLGSIWRCFDWTNVRLVLM